MLRSFWQECGLKNRQKPLRVIFLPSLANQACRSQLQLGSSISIAGPGIVLLYMHCEPREFFLILSAAVHFTSFPFLFFFFFLPSIVALHKHWRMLNYLTASSAAACFGDGRSPLAARFREFMHLTFSTDSANIRVAFVVVAVSSFFFFSFIFSPFLSFSLWWLQTTFLGRNSLGVHVNRDVIRSTTTQCVDVDFPLKAIEALGHFAICMGKRAGFFGAHGVQAQRRWGRPLQGLPGALEKNLTELEGCLQTWSPINQPANLHRANAQIERKVSWRALVASHAFEVPTSCDYRGPS